MEVLTKLAELQRERHQVIAISDAISADLRTLRVANELAKSPQEIESVSRQHRRALQSYARAQQRLRELNASIKWHNLAVQEEIRQQAKHEKKARQKMIKEQQ